MLDRSETLYTETEPLDSDEQPSTKVCSSNDQICTTLTTRRGNRPEFYNELKIFIGQRNVHSSRITIGIIDVPIQTEASPNGYYLLVNPVDAAHGFPSVHGYPRIYNLPLIALQIEGR